MITVGDMQDALMGKDRALPIYLLDLQGEPHKSTAIASVTTIELSAQGASRVEGIALLRQEQVDAMFRPQ